jgi:hypothetical protein
MTSTILKTRLSPSLSLSRETKTSWTAPLLALSPVKLGFDEALFVVTAFMRLSRKYPMNRVTTNQKVAVSS